MKNREHHGTPIKMWWKIMGKSLGHLHGKLRGDDRDIWGWVKTYELPSGYLT